MRHLLTSLSIAALLVTAGAVVLTACSTSGTAPPVTPQSIITQAVATAQGLDGMLTQLAITDPTLVPASVVTQSHAALADAQAAAAILVAGMPQATSASTLKTVEDDIDSVLTMLASPPVNGLIPAPFNQAVAAASIIAPMLQAFVAPYFPAAAASPAVVVAQAKLRAAAPQITTADQAVAALQKFATR